MLELGVGLGECVGIGVGGGDNDSEDSRRVSQGDVADPNLPVIDPFEICPLSRFSSNWQARPVG